MRKYFIIAICLLLLVTISGFGGCGKKAAEKTAEKSIEEATGGEADVDVDEGSIKINTNEGTFEAGEKVSLPSGFPSDVYVIDGDIVGATSTDEEYYSVSIKASKSVSEVADLYESKLQTDGWTINMKLSFEDSVTLGGEKDNRTVTVGINKDDDGKTFVVLNVAPSS